MQLNVFQLQQTTRIGKDEVLVTSLFCRIIDGNGFHTSLDPAHRVSASTVQIGKDEVLVTSLLCRIIDGNGFHRSLNAAQRVPTLTNNANRKR